MDELMLNGKTLLVVDDEADLRDIVASELEFMGSRVFQAENVKVAQQLLSEHDIDLVVSDIRMPGGTGVDLLNSMKHKNVLNPPIILITGFADITLEDALDKGAEALMSKPFKLDDLIQTVVKYTRSPQVRFSQNVITTQHLEWDFFTTMAGGVFNKRFLIGRGGISFIFQPEGKKYALGDHIKFRLIFEDRELNGVGICRSFKYIENSQVSVGLEFEHLEPQTLDFFLKYWRENRIVAFIPAIK